MRAGDRRRQREALEWALTSNRPLSPESRVQVFFILLIFMMLIKCLLFDWIVQFLCELAEGGQYGDVAKLEQAGIDHESLLEQHRHLRDLHSSLLDLS
jgi:hypothetical protein